MAQNFQTDCLSVMAAQPGLVASILVSPCTPSTHLSFLSVLIWNALDLWVMKTFLGQVILCRTQAMRNLLLLHSGVKTSLLTHVFLIFQMENASVVISPVSFLLQLYPYHHMLNLNKSLSFTNINFWDLLFLASQSVT